MGYSISKSIENSFSSATKIDIKTSAQNKTEKKSSGHPSTEISFSIEDGQCPMRFLRSLSTQNRARSKLKTVYIIIVPN